MLNKHDHLNILRSIEKSSKINQRQLASQLGFSLGKLNYCLKELKKKGFVKIKNFKKNPNRFNLLSKANYLYILTPKGITQKTKLTLRFMKIKMQEYDELKKDLENEKNNKI
jgi:EPS-associated MarR family transcriptional regulator|tara:strand:+ start:356 stop:691 length:336 start_codon:yes stop_codon:yes gene_type:complete